VASFDQLGSRRGGRGAERGDRAFGAPEVMNTDQGSQFTAAEFIGVLKAHDIRISMDGKGCWRDNVFVERLWKTIEHLPQKVHSATVKPMVMTFSYRPLSVFFSLGDDHLAEFPALGVRDQRIAGAA
jgi:transposase InsO family protein